ncbi:GAP family protein [Mycobacterium sp.]|uniref:GAP family protein n=1 Tax=Mycobacterium sp. TaxID=1785 RepID=UPI002D95EAA8|nr:GAP family protein [Mycobacterium sp.]
MWITVLVMAVAASLEPFRIGMTVLMLNRPRPILQLLAFLSGGFAMGTAVGLVVLMVFRPQLPGSAHFTLPKVQIMMGVMALLVAAVLATKVLSGRFERHYAAGRARQLLKGRSLWVAGTAGLGIALPSVDYLAVLAVILASGAAPAAQMGALLMFNVVAFALVEFPLVAYLIAPNTTRAWMAALHGWLRSCSPRAVAALLAGLGCALLVVGFTGL